MKIEEKMHGEESNFLVREHQITVDKINDELVRLQDDSIKPYKARVLALEAAIERSGMDLTSCLKCSKEVVSVPDGLAMCEACAIEEGA
jgi:hypothetical protein